MIILQTPRLVLRQMTQDDLPALKRTLQDPVAMTAYEHAFSDQESQDWLDRQLARYDRDGFGLWAVASRETGKWLGQCGISMQDWNGVLLPEVGYLFEHAHWHHGYATEAAMACRDYAFETLRLGEVFTIIRDTNLPSQRVAERCGMTRRETGIRRYYGMDMPHYLYSIRREEWEK